MEQGIDLPRLALNYYWLIALGMLLVALGIGFAGRKVFVIERIASRIALICAAYMAASSLVMGKIYGFASYQMETDLCWILIVTLPIAVVLMVLYDMVIWGRSGGRNP